MRSILIASRLACPAASILTDRRQRGDTIDTAPPGWFPPSLHEAFEAIRGDDPAGLRDPCAVQLRSGAPTQASIKEWADATSQEPLPPDHHEPVKVTSEPRVIEAAPRTAAMTATTLDDAAVIVGLAAKAGSRDQIIAFEGPAADGLALDRSLAVLEAEARARPDGVESASEGADPLLPQGRPS